MFTKVALSCVLALAVSTLACGGSGPEPERSADPLTEEEDAGSDPPAAAPTPAVDPDTAAGQTDTGGGWAGGGSEAPSVGSPGVSNHEPRKQ
jgi:hypothetical protein